MKRRGLIFFAPFYSFLQNEKDKKTPFPRGEKRRAYVFGVEIVGAGAVVGAVLVDLLSAGLSARFPIAREVAHPPPLAPQLGDLLQFPSTLPPLPKKAVLTSSSRRS